MANYTLEHYFCSDKGLLLPFLNEYTWNNKVRAFLYFIGMLWCFLGVAIVSNAFMCGIEHITSKTRRISVPNPKGEGVKVLEVKIWNDTVANLTLLAFGTSAPEILLNIIEICGHKFVAGDLGPGTIVGSAAFNLYVITAVSITALPRGETRRIKNLTVFAITTAFGLFAYVWLILVLLVITPNVVDLWEAIVTFAFFPTLILLAYFGDKGSACKTNKTAAEIEIGLDLDEVVGDERGSANIINIARELAKDRTITEDEAARAMAAEMVKDQPKPKGWYRVNATRLLTGGHRLKPRVSLALGEVIEKLKRQSRDPSTRQASLLENGSMSNGIDTYKDNVLPGRKAVVEFTTAISSVLESEGSVRLGVRRTGDLSREIKVGVETNDGTACANEDYKPLQQILTFGPRDTYKDIFVDIIDDEVWEPDEFFFVRLYHHPLGSKEEDLTFGKISINQVTIINDDEPGKVQFSKPSFIVKESTGAAQVVVSRISGADGEISVKWKTSDLTAKTGQDYAGAQGKVTFKHGEASKVITIDIYGINDPKKHDPNFQVELFDPTGGAEIGKISKSIVTIINDEEFNHILTRISNKAKQNLEGLSLNTSSWKEQFRCAMQVNGGNWETATLFDYVMHFMTFFWKVVFAFIPPPQYCGGWLAFLSSLLLIGFLTAIVSDLATIFGCLVGLSDIITAITFVAMGTSMPDTFASRTAAINEKWADAAIGNINGSNSVNVFLGLGLPWLLASIYWETKGRKFDYHSGALGLSVTIFTLCALLVLLSLVCRRRMRIFGMAELGGPTVTKYLSAGVMIALWIFYIVLSSLQAQGILNAHF